MKTNVHHWKSLLLIFLVTLFCLGNETLAQTAIFNNPISGTNITASPYTTGQVLENGLSSTGIARGTGLSSSSADNRYNASGWTGSSSLSTSDYFSFPITPSTGYHVNFSSFVYTGQRSGSGPTSFAFRHSSSSFATNIGSPNSTGTTLSLTGASFQNITAASEFRFYGWNSSGGSFSINDFTFNGSVLGTDVVSLTGFSACQNTAGTAQSFVIDGAGLVPASGNITIAPSANYEVSVTSATSGFLGSGSATVAYTGGTINKTVWIRLKANAVTGNYNNEDINVSGGGFSVANGIDVTCSGTVNGNSTLSLSSVAGTDNQTKCINTAITNITYTVGGGGTGATVTGLPSGVTGSYNSGTKVYTISGTPNVSGTFNYTVTTTGPCTNTSLNGTINVTANTTITLTSGTGSNNQTRCINNAITDITYTIGGTGTGASVTGLPAGVTGVYNAGTFTISGTPTASGTFNYTVNTSGPCSNPTATGTIIVNANSTLTFSSSPGTDNQTKCINTAITNITYTVGGGGTGATVTGLPSGVAGSYNSGTKVYTISGTPTVSGTFNYTVTTTGPCINTSLSGTINVTANATLTLTSAVGSNTQTVCQNIAITNITYSVGGTGTGANVTGLPAGVTGVYNAGVVTISGSPSATGTFNFTVTTTGPCSNPSLTGTISVNTLPSASLIASPSTICIGQSATLSGTNSGGALNYVYSGSASPSQAIPESSGSYTYSSINLSAGSATLASTDLLQVTLNISHNNISDLDIFLVDPSGTKAILLSSDNGGSDNNYTNTVLSTSASNIIGTTGNNSGPFTGTYRMEGTLTTAPDRTGAIFGGNYNSVVPASALSGAAINGSWTLRVFDDNFNFTTGTLQSWSLSITQPGAYNSVFNGPASINPASPSGSNINPSATVTPPVGVNQYTVTTTDVNGCSTTSLPVTVTVQDNASISLTSAELTDAQTLCINNAITDITYSIGGTATGASITAGALPAGVTGTYNAGVFTISGTPTVSGTFSYTVTTTGGPCVNPSLSGVITVTGNATLDLSSSAGTEAQTLCINTPITNITYQTGGTATSAYVVGLPAGLNSNFNAGVLTISGTPTESGVFGYTVFTTGPCVNPTLNGTVTVTSDATIALGSGSVDQSLCLGNPIGAIVYNIGGSGNNATASGLPPGVSGVYNAGVFTISGIPSAAGVYNYTVTATGPCGSATTASHSLIVASGDLPVVSGQVNVCQYVGTLAQVTYTAVAEGATSFNWTLPPNVTLVSQTNNPGVGTITLSFAGGFTAHPNKQLRVRAVSACGVSPLVIYYLQAQTPSTPQPIVASTTNVCPSLGTNVAITYTIPKVAGASGYIWNAQSGTTTITHPNGLGINDTTVTVTFTSGFTTSNITVQAFNPCGTSGGRALTITRANPATPGLIGGPVNVCTNIAPNGTAATYTVGQQPTATSYTWNLPSGVIGLTGQGTNSVSFTYPAGYTGGLMSVTASNGCGTSLPRNLTVATLSPATPSVIDVIQTTACPNRIYSYSLSGMPANATTVNWTYPAGGTVVNQGAYSISIEYPSTSVVGTVTAQSVNNCGSSVIRSLPILIPACPPEEKMPGNSPVIFTKGGSTSTVETFQAQLYPNPSISEFNLKVISNDKNSQVTVRLLDMQGRELKRILVMPDNLKSFGNDLKAGTYLVELLQGNNRLVQKLIKL